eukprot:TRINITY_DN21297_c0_g1_i1.p1 TRINITY_DN21297_c0_g1~~TRINITY_DN21297_c0_g1_i1.p1  ORF type:complete len:760 (+),score=201.85 TRINITY_DN21297_c0_g1_i1:187-2466(+)
MPRAGRTGGASDLSQASQSTASPRRSAQSSQSTTQHSAAPAARSPSTGARTPPSQSRFLEGHPMTGPEFIAEWSRLQQQAGAAAAQQQSRGNGNGGARGQHSDGQSPPTVAGARNPDSQDLTGFPPAAQWHTPAQPGPPPAGQTGGRTPIGKRRRRGGATAAAAAAAAAADGPGSTRTPGPAQRLSDGRTARSLDWRDSVPEVPFDVAAAFDDSQPPPPPPPPPRVRPGELEESQGQFAGLCSPFGSFDSLAARVPGTDPSPGGLLSHSQLGAGEGLLDAREQGAGLLSADDVRNTAFGSTVDDLPQQLAPAEASAPLLGGAAAGGVGSVLLPPHPEEEDDSQDTALMRTRPMRPYRYASSLGEGEFGEVWKIEDSRGDLFAAKVLPQRSSDPRMQSYAEAVHMATAGNAQVVRLYDMLPVFDINNIPQTALGNLRQYPLKGEPVEYRSYAGLTRAAVVLDACVDSGGQPVTYCIRCQDNGQVVGQVHPDRLTRLLECAAPAAIIMPLFAGTLNSICAYGPLQPPDLHRCLAHVMLGTRSLHRRGLAHGDLKPGNIFANRRGDGGFDFVVADLGLTAPTGTFDHDAIAVDEWCIGCLGAVAAGLRKTWDDVGQTHTITDREWMYPEEYTARRVWGFVQGQSCGRAAEEAVRSSLFSPLERHERGTRNWDPLKGTLQRLLGSADDRVRGEAVAVLRGKPGVWMSLTELTRADRVSRYAPRAVDVTRALHGEAGLAWASRCSGALLVRYVGTDHRYMGLIG